MINRDELLFSVDEHNRPIAPQPRGLSHRTGIWHRACHVWIVNNRGQILCQQRSLQKDSNPGLWEPFFGGHLAPGQEYLDAALGELAEELGLHIKPDALHFFTEYKYDKGTEFQGLYVLQHDVDISSLQLEKDEVEAVTWRDAADIRRLVVDEKDSGWTVIGYEKALLDWMQNQGFIRA